MPQLNWKIDLGHLLTIIIMLVTLAAGYGRITAKLDSLQSQVDRMQGFSERLVRVETQVQDRRTFPN